MSIMTALFTQIYSQRVEGGETTVGDAFTSSITFLDQLQSLSNNGVSKCKVRFGPGEQRDEAKIVFDFTPRTHGPYCRSHGELGCAQNQLDVGYEFRNYHPRLQRVCEGTRAGWLYRYNKNLTGWYWKHNFPSLFGWRPEFQHTQGKRKIEACCTEVFRKQSFTFKRDFPEAWLHNLMQLEGDRAEIFRHNCLVSPENHIYFKFSRKFRDNRIYDRHSSAELIDRALGESRVQSVKLGFKAGNLALTRGYDHWMLKASAELSQDRLFRAKVFGRHFRQLARGFYVTTSGSAGLTKSPQQKLQVNDAFYLNNFKGIPNIGYHYEPEAKKKGLGGDILGFDKYAQLQLKVGQLDCPYLESQGVDPFIFGSVALAPNRACQEASSLRLIKDCLRGSAGFGLTLRTNFFTIECYYNLFVKKQGNEMASEFQINLGLD